MGWMYFIYYRSIFNYTISFNFLIFCFYSMDGYFTNWFYS